MTMTLKRFSFLLVLVAWAWPSLGDERPNVLIITLDDLHYDSLGATGCPLPGITPNLDKLAEEGVLFTQAHVVTTICGPSRNVLLSGRYPHNNGALGHGKITPDDWEPPATPTPQLQRLLRGEGYLTAAFFKHGRLVDGSWDVDYVEGPMGVYRPERDPSWFYRRTKEVVERSREEEKPFFLYANPIDPHLPWPNTPLEESWFKRAEVPEENQPPEPRRIHDPYSIPLPPFLLDREPIRRYLAPYYDSVHRGDACVGQILRALREGGAENTLIVFLSDHGMDVGGAKRNLYYEATRTPLIVSWPGVIGPRRPIGDVIISAVDIVPTILELIGHEGLRTTDGQSFAPVLHGDEIPGERGYAYGAFNWQYDIEPDQYCPSRSIVDGEFLYIWNAYETLSSGPVEHIDGLYPLTYYKMNMETDLVAAMRWQQQTFRGEEELYFIGKDPGCWFNLANEAKYGDALQSMRRRLMQEMERSGDPLFARYPFAR